MYTLNQGRLLIRYMQLFPRVKHEMSVLHNKSEEMPQVLKKQAQSSLEHKAFHCIGGAVYALYPHVNRSIMLNAIINLQTISDYLDNLCDRMEVSDDAAFRQLHLSFLHALTPQQRVVDYYAFYPYKESVYLAELVRNTQAAIEQMPYYSQYQAQILVFAKHYCELQIRKHLVPDGETVLRTYINDTFAPNCLGWNEWAAAMGSTLGIFMCFAASFHRYNGATKQKIMDAYFPWIQSLHILLDYYIDQHEDQIYGDLNFTSYYSNQQESANRLGFFLTEAKERLRNLPYPGFHDFVLRGLVAMYGSDPKLSHSNLLSPYQRALTTQRSSRVMYRLCMWLRKHKYLA